MKEIKSGQKVKVTFQTVSSKEDVLCSIKWWEDDRVGLLYPPDKDYLIKFLPEEKELSVLLFSDKGILSFKSVVIESPANVDFVIEIPEEPEVIQRRGYLRVPTYMKFLITNRTKAVNCEAVDISGGGLKFICKERLAVNTVWSMSLTLNQEHIKITGKILHCNEMDKKFAYAVEFTDINENTRSKIIKYCFDQEIKFRKMQRE